MFRRRHDKRARALLQRAVNEAQFAVLAAQAAGAPAGELDALCQRLREQAEAGRWSSGIAGPLAAARMIQDSAVAAVAWLPGSADRAADLGQRAGAIAGLIGGDQPATGQPEAAVTR